MTVSVLGLNAIDGEVNRKLERSFRVTYHVVATASPTVDTEVAVASAVSSAVGMTIGSPWVNNSAAYCNSIKARCLRRRDGASPSWAWAVDFDFSTLQLSEMSFSLEKYEWPTTRTVNDKPITNSAGDPVIRLKKRSRVAFRFSRIMAAWDWRHARDASIDGLGGIMYGMNREPWLPSGPFAAQFGTTPVDPFCARIEDVRATASYDYAGSVKVEIDVRVDEDGFAEKFVDQGYFYFGPDVMNNPYAPDPSPDVPFPEGGAPDPAPSRRRAIDGNGFSRQPINLNGFGGELPAKTPPVINKFNLYCQIDFNAFPLGGPGGFFS